MNIDADGNFIKTTLNEKGTTIIWTWDAEKNAWYTPFFKGFIWDRATEDNKYFSDQLHMSVLIDESIKGFPTITHHDNIDPPNTKNWTSLFQNQLFLQMVDDGMFPNKQSIDLGPWYDNSHKFRRDFTNADGPQRIILTDGLKIALHIRGDFVALKANMETNGFSLLDLLHKC